MDADDLQGFLDHVLAEGVSLDSLSFDDLTDMMVSADIDPSQLSDEQMDSLMELCSGSSPVHSAVEIDPHSSDSTSADASGSKHDHEVRFGASGKCGWCYGTGVVWSGSQNKSCYHCGGSGIGPN